MPRTRSRRDDYDDPEQGRGRGRRGRPRDEAFDPDDVPARPGQLSANGQWLFGSLFAGLILVGFAFGVWAGASRSKPVEVAEAKPKDGDKPAPAAQPEPPKAKEPEKAREPEPEPNKPEPEPEPKKAEPKAKEPEPEPKRPEPKSAEPEPKKANVKPVAFKEVQPILMGYCTKCHGDPGRKPGAGVDLRTLASIMKGGKDGEVVVPGDPKKSRLYASIVEGSMPSEGQGPNPKELQLIHDWILSGAK